MLDTVTWLNFHTNNFADWTYLTIVNQCLSFRPQVSVFTSQSCEHIKNRHASFGLFDNVVHTSKTWYNVSFSVFFLNIVNTSRRMMQVFVFFHNVVNKSKICDGNLGLFSKCWKHMKNRNARLGLFTTFSTHQKPS